MTAKPKDIHLPDSSIRMKYQACSVTISGLISSFLFTSNLPQTRLSNAADHSCSIRASQGFFYLYPFKLSSSEWIKALNSC